MRIRRFLHIILGLTALFLIWQIVEDWNRTPPTAHVRSDQGREGEASLIGLPARSPQVGKRFAQQITNKDLFSPDRKRPEAVKETVQAEPIPSPSHLKLVGVLLTPGREEAFLADSKQGNKVMRVQKGEQIEQYRLATLTSSQVTLSIGDDGTEVALPLVLLDSQSAKKVPRLTPEKSQAKANQKRTRQARQAQQRRGGSAGANQKGDESVKIRQNIQQLQRRLRQIRRQSARDRRAELEER